MIKENKITIIILLIVFSIIGIVVYFINRNQLELDEKNKTTEYHELVLLSDESLFFSISENINNLCKMISNGFRDNVYDILDKDYTFENNISIDNVLSYFTDYQNTSFQASEIYVISNKNNYIFLVQGYLKNDVMDQVNYIKDTKNYVLYYNIDESSYAIYPIDKGKYEKLIVSNDFKFKTISHNDNNNFNITNYDESIIAAIYYNDIISNIYSNPSYIYDKIGTRTKNKYFNTLEEFIDYTSKNDLITSGMLEKYNKVSNTYNLVDSNNTLYTVNVIHGLNYSVEISFDKD